jgi:la-related protein 1
LLNTKGIARGQNSRETATSTMSGPTPSFSYAQAAKGLASSQNSTPSSRIASGAITPAKDSVTSPVIPAINGTAHENLDSLKVEKLHTDTVEHAKPTPLRNTKLPNGTSSPASPPFGDSSMSTLPREDDMSSQQNTASESNWENVSQVSAAQETVKQADEKKDKADDGAKLDSSWVQVPKPTELAEAPPPKVNIWTQRLEQQTVKKPTAASTTSDSSDTVGPENGLNIQGLKKEQAREKVQPPKQNGHDDKPRRASGKKINAEEKTPAPPSINDEASWPTPAPEGHEEERKLSIDKTPALDKDKNKGKKAWAKLDMPPPSVVFQTALPNAHPRRGGRAGGRGGREGGGRSSPPGRGNREERQSGSNRDKESTNPSTSPKGKRVASDEVSRRDSRYLRENGVNGDVSQNGKALVGQEDGKPAFNTFPRNGAKNNRRQDGPAEGEKKKDSKSETAEAPVEAASKPTPVVASEEHQPKPGSTTEPLPAQKFPRNGNGHMPYQPNRRGSVRGRGAHHGFHTPGHQSGFQNYNMNRSPPIVHDNFYSPHMGRGGFRGGRNSIPADYGRFAGPYAPQGGMLPPLNTFVGQDMMYDQPMQPMSAMPFNMPLSSYNTLGSVSIQIEYYFSLENLIKDNYLRRHMDTQGYVLLTFIADFKRLKALSSDLDVIRLAVQQSRNLELRLGVDGKDRVRVRDGWQQWVLEKSLRDPTAQHDGVDGQPVPPMDFNSIPARQGSLPGPFPGYPASAYPTMNGHGHPRQEFFSSPQGDVSNFARFQNSPPHMTQPPFSPPPHMQDQMMRSPQPAQFHKDNGLNNMNRSPVSQQGQGEQQFQPQPYVNGGSPVGPNGTGPHE